MDRETIELVFMIAIQHLPPQTRAVLILRDVLGWRAKDCAELLETTEAAVNSALQRARAGLKEHLPAERGEWAAAGSAAERELVERYVVACEAGDAWGIAALMAEDARFMMPPEPGVYFGRDTIVAGLDRGRLRRPSSEIRTLVTRANRQPVVANYFRKPGEDVFEALGARRPADRGRTDRRHHRVRILAVCGLWLARSAVKEWADRTTE